MPDDLHPSDGVRLLLERKSVESDDAAASYLGSVFTPNERFDYEIKLDLAGTASLVAKGRAAPDALETKLANIAKSTARAAKRKLGEQLPPWPARILRWRKI